MFLARLKVADNILKTAATLKSHHQNFHHQQQIPSIFDRGYRLACSCFAWCAGSLVLGQNQDCYGGCFDPQSSFDGDLADVRIWDQVLPQVLSHPASVTAGCRRSKTPWSLVMTAVHSVFSCAM